MNEHGTYAGWNWHMRQRQSPCEACQMAARDYMRQRRAFSPDTRELDRWYARTRRAALERLALRHAWELAELLAEERQKDPDPRVAVTA